MNRLYYYLYNKGESMKINNIFLTTALALIAIIIIVLMINLINSYEGAIDNGQITIEVIDIDQSIIESKTIYYVKGQTLTMLIETHFNDVIFEETVYGPFLKAIEGYVTPNDYSTYLSLYINDQYSLLGISKIKIVNQMIVSIRVVSSI